MRADICQSLVLELAELIELGSDNPSLGQFQEIVAHKHLYRKFVFGRFDAGESVRFVVHGYSDIFH